MNSRLFNRRDFLKANAGLIGIGLSASAFLLPDHPDRPSRPLPPLSFSTLGCPDWPYATILSFAAANHYQGIELRGIQRQLDLTKCPEFSSPAAINTTRRQTADKGLVFVDLGSSCELHHSDPAERQKNLDEGRRFIDLAHEIGCPNVRVFPNKLPKDQGREAAIELITKGLQELAAYAKSSGVRVLMESHGDEVISDELKSIMDNAASPGAGLVWDVFNMWSVTKEPPAKVYEKLKPYIYHTHIKDGRITDGKIEYTLLGQGESPIFEAVDVLYAGGYSGYYSFEWEKLWHPEIKASDIALADYPVAMKQHFQSAAS